MALILLVLLLAIILGAVGFVGALHFLWIIALIVLVVWALGFLFRAAEGGSRRRWYRWYAGLRPGADPHPAPGPKLLV